MRNNSAFNVFTRILHRTELSRLEIGQCFSRLVKSNSVACCEALRIYLDTRFADLVHSQLPASEEKREAESLFIRNYRLHEEFRKIFEEFRLQNVLGEAAQQTPEAFVEYLLPWFITVVTPDSYHDGMRQDRYSNDSMFSFELYSAYAPRDHGNDAPMFTESLISALRAIALANPLHFRDIAARLAAVETEAAQSVLVRTYIVHPGEYSADIYAYLVEDVRRFDLGDNRYDACQLVGAVFSHLDAKQRTHLEEIILKLAPMWELHRRGIGYTQTLFLKSIDPSLLSAKARYRLQELERKYPQVEPRPLAMDARFGTVGSPISSSVIDKMNDADLLSAMRVYDESTGWDTPRTARKRLNDDFLKGGLVELSRLIGEKTQEHPDRFYRLTQRLDSTIAVAYISQILSGLAAANVPAQWLFDVADRFAPRFVGPERTAYCRALLRRAEDTVPDHLLDIMTEWANKDDDPDPERIPHNGHEWLQQGMNSVRGVAVEAVVRCCLEGDPRRVKRAIELLSQAVHDPSPSVAACALHNLLSLLNDEQNRTIALNICEAILEHHAAILEDEFTYQFLNWATFHYYDRFGHHISTMLNSTHEHTRQEGARLATQAALSNTQAEAQAARARSGDNYMRRGAAQTYAMYLRNPEWQTIAEQHLRTFMYDKDDEVLREVAFSFSYFKHEDIELLREFTFAFIHSPALSRETRHAIDFVKPMAADEYELALELTRVILQALQEKKIEDFWDPDLVSLPLAVYNRSRIEQVKDQAINLFELALQLGVRGAKDALNDWDEFRDWSKLLFHDEQ